VGISWRPAGVAAVAQVGAAAEAPAGRLAVPAAAVAELRPPAAALTAAQPG